jgi:hypothetical protein
MHVTLPMLDTSAHPPIILFTVYVLFSNRTHNAGFVIE